MSRARSSARARAVRGRIVDDAAPLGGTRRVDVRDRVSSGAFPQRNARCTAHAAYAEVLSRVEAMSSAQHRREREQTKRAPARSRVDTNREMRRYDVTFDMGTIMVADPSVSV
jgi:hypothetical protein